MENNFACVCDGGMGAIGTPACIIRGGLSVKDIFMNTFDGTGQRNSVKSTDLVDGVLPLSYLLAMLNHSDPTKRWNITPDKYEEAAPSRTENQSQESNTGTFKHLRNGVKLFLAELWDVPESWAAKINQAKCNRMSTFRVDEAGNMSGEASIDGSEWFPLMIEKGTLNATPIDAVGAKDPHTTVSYQLSRLVVEGNYLTLSAAEIGGDLRSADSMIAITLTQGSGTNSTTELYIDTKRTFDNSGGLLGAVTPADWTITDSALAPVVASNIEEIEDGNYKFTIPTSPTGATKVSYSKTRTALSEQGWFAEELTVTIPV